MSGYSKRAERVRSIPRWATAAALAIALVPPAKAADLSARDVSILLFHAAPASHPALTNRNFERLDLAGLNFKQADLRQSNFFGADLSGTDLSDTDLRGAKLDRVTLISARLDHSRFDDGSLMRPSTSSGFTPLPREAPSFKDASLKRTHFFGDFTGSDFSGADLTDSVCAPTNKSGFIEHIWRTIFLSANLTGANLTRADMTRAQLSFANLRGAILRSADLQDVDLSGADLSGADLTDADLSGADLTDANVAGADLSGVRLHGAKGIETLKGLALARNSEKIVR
jgi:uncharacterized protein YjbI with pentapeptide repeats